jgi:hypothetical protein
MGDYTLCEPFNEMFGAMVGSKNESGSHSS